MAAISYFILYRVRLAAGGDYGMQLRIADGQSAGAEV